MPGQDVFRVHAAPSRTSDKSLPSAHMEQSESGPQPLAQQTFIQSDMSSNSFRCKKEFLRRARGPSASSKRHTWNLSQKPFFSEQAAPGTSGRLLPWKNRCRTEDVVLAHVRGLPAGKQNAAAQCSASGLMKNYNKRQIIADNLFTGDDDLCIRCFYSKHHPIQKAGAACP